MSLFDYKELDHLARCLIIHLQQKYTQEDQQMRDEAWEAEVRKVVGLIRGFPTSGYAEQPALPGPLGLAATQGRCYYNTDSRPFEVKHVFLPINSWRIAGEIFTPKLDTHVLNAKYNGFGLNARVLHHALRFSRPVVV